MANLERIVSCPLHFVMRKQMTFGWGCFKGDFNQTDTSFVNI